MVSIPAYLPQSSTSGSSCVALPENWKQFQEPVHHLLFFAFVDAGYHYNGGDFHSTKPMKRVMASGRLYRAETGITERYDRVEYREIGQEHAAR